MNSQGIGLVPQYDFYKPNGYIYQYGLGILPYFVVRQIATQHPAEGLHLCSLAVRKRPANKCE